MVLQTPTLEDIINSFIEDISTNIPELTTTPGSVARQTLINPAASQISFLFDFAKRVSVVQDIFQATGSDLDALANTYGLTRRPGTTASGIMYVDLTQLLGIQQITVNAGTVIRSSLQGGNNVSYTVVGSYAFSSTDRAIFEATAASVRSMLDSVGLTNMKLAATVPIQAASSGTQGNIGAYTLNNTLITNIPNVINLSPTSGGTNTESDDSLRQRLVSIFTGNSVGTAASLLSAALTPSSVTGGFLVRSGDPLMTRDGSVYDNKGNLITAGTGRAVDIYVQGQSLSTSTNSIIFTENNKSNFVSYQNSTLVGQSTTGQTSGQLPVYSVSSIAGTESGATFSQGILTQDSEGNILVEGNFALIKDIEAHKYSIVENLITKERKLAYSLSPTNTLYTVVETIPTSDLANSTQSQDRILFLTNKVEVTDELTTRGNYNGADQLIYNNVINTTEVYQEISISETLKVEQFQEVAGGITLNLKHAPLVSISSITNVRLGSNVDVQILDASTSLIKLVGRFPPRAGDLLLVNYVWQNIFQENLNYSLSGDLVKWGTLSTQQENSSSLLAEQPLEAQNTISKQPSVASHIQTTVAGVPDREVVQLDITGTTASVVNKQKAVKTSQDYAFSLVGTNNIASILKVTNSSKGYNYNLTNYSLQKNLFDKKAKVNTNLLPQQFQLDSKANNSLLQPGDKIVLGTPTQTISWSSQSDFENNILGNLSPIYDPTKLSFTTGGLVLNNRTTNSGLSPTSISGFITQNTTLSGLIEVTGDLIIQEGVVVDIQPDTIIKVQSSQQSTSKLQFAQQLMFDGYFDQTAATSLIDAYSNLYTVPATTTYNEFYFIYVQPTNFSSNSFTIINDSGDTLSIRFTQDILTKQVVGSQVTFFISGRQVDQAFNQDLEATIDLNNTNYSIKATLLGAKSGQGGSSLFTTSLVQSQNKYYVLLDKIPTLTNSLQNDFVLTVDGYSDVAFQRFSYNSILNALVVDGSILVTDGYGDQTSATPYILSYYTTQTSRISIIVEGTLRIQGTSPQTSVLFTSSSTNPSAGDWEGIIFTSKSHTRNPKTLFQSQLVNARILYANNGITINTSDPIIQNNIIKDSLGTGIQVQSTNVASPLYSGTNFNLLELSGINTYFNSETRLNFTSSDNVQVARYTIPDNVATALGMVPSYKTKLSSTRYVVDLVYGTDYTLFIEGQNVASIDTDLPQDGYSNYSLSPGNDFMIEYDINLGYSLVFLYTAGSNKYKNVFNLMTTLFNTQRTGKIQLTYYSTVPNSAIYDNLVANAAQGVVLGSLATTSVNRNTINGTNIGIVATNSIATIRNNLVTDYKVASISIDNSSLLKVQRNDLFSKYITNNEQVAVTDTDLLIQNISTYTLTLVVRTPNKYKVGSLLQIDQEQMLVQAVNNDSIVVARGQNNTTLTSHNSGSIVSIHQLNIIFSVSGIDGDYCELIETDQFGTQLAAALPLEMKLVAPNTFRVATPVNRRVNFYYKYNYYKQNNNFKHQTQTKVLPKNQFGTGVVDVVNIVHEIPLASQDYSPNNENYSADPLYYNPSSYDFSYSPLYSYASRQHPVYGSLIVPKTSHRYVGFLDVSLSQLLSTGTTRIPVSYEPLIVNNYSEVTVVGNDSITQGSVLKVSSFTYLVTAEEADQGAVGVFIIDSTTSPHGVSVAGSYNINYAQPIDLGTSIPSYYIETTVSYTIDAGSQVTFDNITFTKDVVGGDILFSMNVADSTANLPSILTSMQSDTSPINVSEISNTNIGKTTIIQITLKGNDGSFASGYLYPILRDFQLQYLPSKDLNEYKVLSLIKNPILNQTNILIDSPITNSTYSAVGSSTTLELYVRTRASSYDPSSEFILTTTETVTPGDTFIKAFGDLTTTKPDASPGDIITVDYLSYNPNNKETLYFVQNDTQVSQNIYISVDSINTTITRDNTNKLPSTETLAVDTINQPATGSTYKASYQFEAPLDGETLNITHNYNQSIKLSQDQVDSKKSIFTDALVKQVTSIPVRVAASITLDATANPTLIQSQVSTAFANMFSTTLSDIQTTRELYASDLVRSTGTIVGIQNITITTLSRNLITGQVQDPVEFTKRESPVLEENSPRITLVQNGRVI